MCYLVTSYEQRCDTMRAKISYLDLMTHDYALCQSWISKKWMALSNSVNAFSSVISRMLAMNILIHLEPLKCLPSPFISWLHVIKLGQLLKSEQVFSQWKSFMTTYVDGMSPIWGKKVKKTPKLKLTIASPLFFPKIKTSSLMWKVNYYLKTRSYLFSRSRVRRSRNLLLNHGMREMFLWLSRVIFG